MPQSGRWMWNLGGVLAGLAVLATLASRPLPAQLPPADAHAPSATPPVSEGTPFTGETSVTAADVVLELTRKQTLLSGNELPDLGPDDFRVVYDGVEVPVVSLEPPGPKAEPWQLVIYADAAQLQVDELAWAARLLGPRLEALLELGSVSIVLADPEPRVLAAGREADVLGGALARLELFARQTLGASEPQILELRRQLLEVLRDPGLQAKLDAEDLTRTELIEAIRQEEARQVDETLQRLRDFLLDLDPPTARRAVLWLGHGVDAHPAEFYDSLVADAAGELIDADASYAEQAIDPTFRTLAAHGWTVLSLLPPPPDDRAGLRRGWRLGKWRLRGLGATYEEDRDPERAAAYLDLGRSLEDQQKAAEAIEAYEKAIFHFAGDPRTSEPQARAYRRLQVLYDAAGNAEAAREAAEYAAILESEAVQRASKEGTTPAAEGASEVPQPHQAWSERFDPWPVAERAADLSVGWVVATQSHLDQALASLHRRVRLTYQITSGGPAASDTSGTTAATTVPIEVETSRGGLVLRAPAAARAPR